MSFWRSAIVCVAAVSFTSFLLSAQVKNEPTVVKIDSHVFDRYVGAYVLGRQYMTVSRKDDHYYVQITGQKPFEIFPDKCHLIVCWKHNWAECPLEVIELKTALSNQQLIS